MCAPRVSSTVPPAARGGRAWKPTHPAALVELVQRSVGDEQPLRSPLKRCVAGLLAAVQKKPRDGVGLTRFSDLPAGVDREVPQVVGDGEVAGDDDEATVADRRSSVARSGGGVGAGGSSL